MPTVSLRMTDAQLAELREWARVGNRSMQREIIWRLFSAEAAGTPKYGPTIEDGRTEVEKLPDADAQPRDIPARTVTPDDHFKPDFKKGRS